MVAVVDVKEARLPVEADTPLAEPVSITFKFCYCRSSSSCQILIDNCCNCCSTSYAPKSENVTDAIGRQLVFSTPSVD